MTIFGVTIKDDNKVHIVGTGLNVKASISIQPKLATILVDIAPSTSTVPEDVGIDVMIQIVDVKKVNVMDDVEGRILLKSKKLLAFYY